MFFGLFVWTQGNSQCYIQLGDYSGFDTSPYLDTLEAAACDLIRSLPSEFQNQFRVYDFGFYRLNEYMEEGVDKIWQEMIRQVEQMTPYYLIFGKESSTQGIYSTIRVAVKLPLAESFGCPLKTNAGLIESDLVNLLNSNDNPYAYAKKEIDAMKYLKWEEILAQFDKQNCDLLYSRLEALGFEARQVKIVEPLLAIAPRSRVSATCNVTDNTDFSVEWYGETRTPASILCSELAEMEGVTQGFIYASDDICTEADLTEVEALINDETLLHVYLKPCGGEEYGVLMEKSPVVRGVSAEVLRKIRVSQEYYWPELAEAFLIFASSSEGYALLSKFGKKDQVLSYAHQKEIPPFKEDGEYYSQGIDLNLIAWDLNGKDEYGNTYVYGGNGSTGFYSNGPNRYLVRVSINKSLNENNVFAENYKLKKTEENRINYTMTRVRTYFHEMVMHAILDAEDWKDNKKKDLSNIPDEHKKNTASSATAQHDYMKASSSVWNINYIPIITAIWIKKNPKIARSTIIDHLKDYH